MNQTPTLSSELVSRLTLLNAQTLTSRARWAHLALLLAALAMAILSGALLATEAALPIRTQVAFAGMLVIALSWVGYAGWVLQRRLTLLANHRVIAAWMAVLWSTVFSAAATALGWFGSKPAGFVAGSVGLVFVAIAVALLVRARRRFKELQARRQQLESALQGARS